MANLSEHTQFENEQALIEANRNPVGRVIETHAIPSEAVLALDKSGDLARLNGAMARFFSDSGKEKIKKYANTAKLRPDTSVEFLKVIGDSYPPVKLKIWLKYDTWSPEEAIAIICGFCQNFKFSGHGSIALENYGRLDGLTPDDEDEMGIPLDLIGQVRAKFENDYATLFHMWSSSPMGDGRRPPADFIDWALRKGVQIYWLDWAVAEGLYRGATIVSDADVDRPIKVTERNTMLKIILGMAKGGYGYDSTKKKSDTPKLVENDLAGMGIAVTDETIRKYLKEASDAFLPITLLPQK